jgi:hypothetical protein
MESLINIAILVNDALRILGIIAMVVVIVISANSAKEKLILTNQNLIEINLKRERNKFQSRKLLNQLKNIFNKLEFLKKKIFVHYFIKSMFRTTDRSVIK